MSFEKWFLQTYEPQDVPLLDKLSKELAYAAYEAGQRDMRERAAEVCRESAIDTTSMRESILCDDLASAIRAIKLESE